MKTPQKAPHDTLRFGLLLALPVLLSSCSDEPASGAAEQHAEGSQQEEEGGEATDFLRLTEAQIAAAGIEVETAGPGEISRYLTLSAMATPNADGALHVNPKAAGIVRSIHKHLGDDVQRGELLCVIDSIDLGKAVSELVRTRALVSAAETTLAREGELFETRLVTAERVLDGAIAVNRRIFEREKDLQEKAVSTIRPMLEAEKALQDSELAKDRELTNLRAERDARLLSLEVELTERRIEYDAARNSLLALGMEPDRLEALEPDSPLLAGTYEIRAARGGIVANRHITSGEYVDATTELFTLQDLSDIWILASAFEEQVRSVHSGQQARIFMDAFPESEFDGTVSLVGYEVDRESRALGLRIEVENKALAEWTERYPLRPGMFGRVELIIDRETVAVALPERAVIHEDDGTYVFLRLAPGEFERRAVELAPPSGALVKVLAGVNPGDEVVVEGAFQLKSALRRDELGDDD